MSKEEDFPGKVTSYLNKRFGGERYFEPYKTDRGKFYRHSAMAGKELKWCVWTGGLLSCSSLEEDVTGKIWVFSGSTGAPDDTLLEEYGIRDPEIRNRIVDELADRRNWRKHVKNFKLLIGTLTWADEMAKRASDESRVEIVHFIPNSRFEGDRSFYYTNFDSSGISDEQKLKEIERRVDAVDGAYKLNQDYEAEKEFWKQHFSEEFLKQVLAQRRRLILKLRLYEHFGKSSEKGKSRRPSP